jgi:hypothetical protein
MSMPPQGSFLPGDVETIGEVLVWKDGALGNHRHAIRPAVEQLLHSMPIGGKPETNNEFS